MNGFRASIGFFKHMASEIGHVLFGMLMKLVFHFAQRQGRSLQFVMHIMFTESQVMQRSKLLPSVQPMLQVTRYHPCIFFSGERFNQWMAVLIKHTLVDHQMAGFQQNCSMGGQLITLHVMRRPVVLLVDGHKTHIWRCQNSAGISKYICTASHLIHCT